jgi:hypothetical protein
MRSIAFSCFEQQRQSCAVARDAGQRSTWQKRKRCFGKVKSYDARISMSFHRGRCFGHYRAETTMKSARVTSRA